jgi:hypothetical protein
LPLEPAAGCASSSNPSRAPYSVELRTKSIDPGSLVLGDYCVPPTTCAALLDAINGTAL